MGKVLSKVTNGQGLWPYLIDKVGIPTTLLIAAVFMLGKPYLQTMNAQADLARECAKSLVEIEQIVREDAAEDKVKRIAELRDSMERHDRVIAATHATQTETLARLARCLEKLNGDGT